MGGQTGHTEGVRVVYDPNQISFVDILRWFWEAHDPASGMGQGNDRGSQYRSGFYYLDDEQQQLIVASKIAYETALGMDGTDQPITTNTVDCGTLVNRTINNTYPNRVHGRIVRHSPGVSRYPVMTIGVPLRMPTSKKNTVPN